MLCGVISFFCLSLFFLGGEEGVSVDWQSVDETFTVDPCKAFMERYLRIFPHTHPKIYD